MRNLRRVQTTTANNQVTPKTGPTTRCPCGKRSIGGGARVIAAAQVPVALTSSGPSGNGWTATAYATGAAANWRLVSFAICA